MNKKFRSLSAILAFVMIICNMNLEVFGSEGAYASSDSVLLSECDEINPELYGTDNLLCEDLLENTKEDCLENTESCSLENTASESLYENVKLSDENTETDDTLLLEDSDAQEVEATENMTRNGSGEEDPGYRVVINRDDLKVGSNITFTVTFDDREPHTGSYEIYMAGEYESGGEVIVVNGNLVVESQRQLTADDYSKTIVVLVYTKIDSTNITMSDGTVFSKLPVVELELDYASFSANNRDTYLESYMKIYGMDSEKYTSYYDDKVEVKGRGSSTWDCVKKPFKLKLDKKADLFGMGKSKHYVLLANDYDKTFLRNKLAYDLSGKFGLTYMESEFVDVAIRSYNGGAVKLDYIGNYLLCEHIRIGKNRVDITDWEDMAEDIAKAVCNDEDTALSDADITLIDEMLSTDFSWMDDLKFTYKGINYDIRDFYDELPLLSDGKLNVSGGFLYEFDEPKSSKPINDPTQFKTAKRNVTTIISKPEYLSTNEVAFESAKNVINDFEAACSTFDGYNSNPVKKNYGGDWVLNDEGKSFTELADVDSMVSYFLINEIFRNYDALRFSRYAYKDIDGKLTFGPAWDFDLALNDIMEEDTWCTAYDGWCFDASTGNGADFFLDWVTTPYFKIKVAEKYWSMSDEINELIKDGGLIDQYSQMLSEAAVADKGRWRYDYKYFTGEHASETDPDYATFVNRFKTNLKNRIEWLNTQFKTKESTIASLNFANNAYKNKTNSKHTITIENESKTNDTGVLAADAILTKCEPVEIKVSTTHHFVTKYIVYVNEIRYGVYDYTPEGEQYNLTCSIDPSAFNAPRGKQNVITVRVLYDKDKASGKPSNLNNFADEYQFATVICDYDKNYDVTFNCGEGNIDGDQNYKVSVSENCLVSKPDNPTLDGYEFVAWYTEPEFENEFDFSTPITDNITLYAKYVKTYTVNFVLNGGKIGDKDSLTQIVSNNGLVIEPENPVLGDKIFVGWCIDEGLKYLYDFSRPVTGDFTLYAKFVNHDDVYITFDCQGGKIGRNEVVVSAVSYNSVAVSEIPVRENHEFLGWFTEKECKNEFDFNTKLTASITLYAGWIAKNYTVTFELNGGKIGDKDSLTQIVSYNGIVTEPDAPVLENKIFEGWYTDKELKYLYNFSRPVKDNITLYAKYADYDDVSVIYVCQGGKIGNEDVLVKVLSYNTIPVEPQIPVRNGYIFDGWFKETGCIHKFNFDEKLTSTLTLYAKWIEDKEEPVHKGMYIENVEDYVYTGAKITQLNLEVYYDDLLLTEGTDYTVSYKNNVNAGYSYDSKSPSVTVKGIGNYGGSVTEDFTIYKAPLPEEELVTTDVAVVAKGKALKPVPTVYRNGKKLNNKKDFTVSYFALADTEFLNPLTSVVVEGEYILRINGCGNYTDYVDISLYAYSDKIPITKCKFKKIPAVSYAGEPIEVKPEIKFSSVTLIENVDYELSYINNDSVGTASVIVKGIGDYRGEKKVDYKISGINIKKAKVTGNNKFNYTGLEICPTPAVNYAGTTLIKDVDYEISYSKNVKAGTATASIKGIGLYTGTIKWTYKINPVAINNDVENIFKTEFPMNSTEYIKGGVKIEPRMMFYDGNGEEYVLRKGIDYTVSFMNNNVVTIDGKLAVATVKGCGNFKGSRSFYYLVTAKDILVPECLDADCAYSKKKDNYKISPTLSDVNGNILKMGTDFTVDAGTYTYLEETSVVNSGKKVLRNAGETVVKGDMAPVGTKFSVVILGKKNYTGSRMLEYQIKHKSIANARVSALSFIYTGDEITLDDSSLNVYLGNCQLYSDSFEILQDTYKNNVNKGTASVKIRGVGDYCGVKTVNFTISAKPIVILNNSLNNALNNALSFLEF